MKEIVFEILNDMAEDLSVLQLKKLQEVLLKRFAEVEHTSEPAKNAEYLNMFIHAKGFVSYVWYFCAKNRPTIICDII